MNKYKIWLTIMVVILLANTTFIVYLWLNNGKGIRRPHDGNSTKEFLIKELSLTKEQQDKYSVLVRQHQDSMRFIQESAKETRDVFFDNINTPVADSILIDSLANNIAQVEVRKEKATLYHFREMRKILTAEQQTKFSSIIKEALQKMGPGKVRPAGPPPNGERRYDGPPPPPHH